MRPFCHEEYASVKYTCTLSFSVIYWCAANSLPLSVVMDSRCSLKGKSSLQTVFATFMAFLPFLSFSISIRLVLISVIGKNNSGGIVGYTAGGRGYGDCMNNFVYGANLIYTGTDGTYGAIAGKLSNYGGDCLSNNYYYGCTLNGEPTVNFGFSGADVDGARGVHTITLGDNISATGSETVTFDGTLYFADGCTVTLSYSGEVPDGQTLTYTVDGEPIEGDTFEMPAKDVVVATTLPDVPYVLGDLNGDDTVDIADVNICINIILGTNNDPVATALADLNGDNSVDIADVNAIINIILTQ